MTQFGLALTATTILMIVATFAFDQISGDIRALNLGARLYRIADRAYDALLVPVARIGSASGHVSYFHTAKHLRGA